MKKIEVKKRWMGLTVLQKAITGAITFALVAAVVAAPLLIAGNDKENKPEVLTVPTLEKIVKVSELSTFTAVYNGIAEVMNEEKSDQIDYYVSYEARVDAGLDMDKIDIDMDEETKTIHITLPPVYIMEPSVDISSLDFIFYNTKANSSTITQQAFRACEEDVKAESTKQDAILELAQQSAVNFVTALVDPFVEQLDAGYTVTVE